jgi:hypothetical protein
MLKKTIQICLYILILLVSMELVLRLAGWKERPRLYEEIEDPDVRWVNSAGFQGIWRSADLRINSRGLRDREYPFNKPADTFRIFAVGECSVIGASVSLEDSFVKQLEVMLNERKPFVKYKRYEVINGGTYQYDELQKLYFAKKYGLKYNPDLIIFSHDISRKPWIEARAGFRPVRLMLKKIPKQFLSIHYLFSYIKDTIEWEMNQFVFIPGASNDEFGRGVVKRYYGEGLTNSKIIPALKELAVLSRERPIPVIVVLMPWLDDLAEDKYAFKWVHKLYAEECEKNGLHLLDLYETCFKNKEPSLFWVNSSNRRPNALGHKMIAEQVYNELISREDLAILK